MQKYQMGAQEVAQRGTKIESVGNVPSSPLANVMNRLREAVSRNQENVERLGITLTPLMDNEPRPTANEPIERDTDNNNLVSVLNSLVDRINSTSNQQNDILDRLQL